MKHSGLLWRISLNLQLSVSQKEETRLYIYKEEKAGVKPISQCIFAECLQLDCERRSKNFRATLGFKSKVKRVWEIESNGRVGSGGGTYRLFKLPFPTVVPFNWIGLLNMCQDSDAQSFISACVTKNRGGVFVGNRPSATCSALPHTRSRSPSNRAPNAWPLTP